MNGTKRPRARAAQLLGGLAALALALLAPCAAASVPRAGEMPVPVDSFSASAIESPIGVAPLSEGLDLTALERALIPDADVTEAPLFSLGDVVLAETEHEQRFGLGPLQLVDVEALRGSPESYPETRIRAFAFLGSTLIGVSRGVSLELLPGYERIGLGLAEGDVVNLYAYVGLQPHAAVDPMGESLMGDILHIGARAAPKVATIVAASFLISTTGPFGVAIVAGMALNTGIAIYGEVGGSDDPVAELLDLGQDVTGIRSAMEGMTGKEAGTGRALSREEQLDAIGDAIGEGAAALAGKAGARLGAGARRMAAAGRGRTGRREASATGRRAGAESREGHARGGTRDHGAQATSRPTHSATGALDEAPRAADLRGSAEITGKGFGRDVRVDRIAREIAASVDLATRVLDSGKSGGTFWGSYYQRLRGTGHWKEQIVRGQAVQALVNRALRENRYIRDDDTLQVLFDRGSVLGLRNRNPLRPDFQIRLGNGDVAIIDITTRGMRGKVKKYRHRRSPILLEVLYD